jgi:hypothetical protein
MLEREDFVGSVWRYGPEFAWPNVALLKLTENGRIGGHDHPNERAWTVTDGRLTILHEDGRETVVFEDVSTDGRRLRLVGKCKLDEVGGIKMLAERVNGAELALGTGAPLADPLQDARSTRLLVAIAFHFRHATVQYLLSVLANYASFPVAGVDVIIHTNAEGDDLAFLQGALALYFPASDTATFRVIIKPVHGLADPWHLVWQHKAEIRERFLAPDSGYTHFIYSEDDLQLSFGNFLYFLKYLPALRPAGLLPAFCVTECSLEGVVYAKEQFNPTPIELRRIVQAGAYRFVNHNNPYNALFILDRALAEEHMASASSDIEGSTQVYPWWVAERAAMGLCFDNVPKGFGARYVVALLAGEDVVPTCALLPHLPNKYANMPDHPISSLALKDLFSRG